MGCYQVFEWLKESRPLWERTLLPQHAESLLIPGNLRMGAASGAEDPDVTFIFPAKDEERTIGEVVEKAKKAAQALGLTCEVVVE